MAPSRVFTSKPPSRLHYLKDFEGAKSNSEPEGSQMVRPYRAIYNSYMDLTNELQLPRVPSPHVYKRGGPCLDLVRKQTLQPNPLFAHKSWANLYVFAI